MHSRDIDPSKISLDFSQFHDLMHRPFTAECREMYGGSRHHIALWWEFMFVPDLSRRTLCRVGLHAWRDGWSRKMGDVRLCRNCMEMREP